MMSVIGMFRQLLLCDKMDSLPAACSLARKRPVWRRSGVKGQLAYHLGFSRHAVFQEGLKSPALNCFDSRFVQTVTKSPDSLDVSQASIQSECSSSTTVPFILALRASFVYRGLGAYNVWTSGPPILALPAGASRYSTAWNEAYCCAELVNARSSATIVAMAAGMLLP